jgi:hypothetical protein
LSWAPGNRSTCFRQFHAFSPVSFNFN